MSVVIGIELIGKLHFKPLHRFMGWGYSRPLRRVADGGGGHKACGCSTA